MGKLFGSDRGLSFFSKEQKQLMIDEQTNFFITGIEKKEAQGDFKEQWVITLIQCNDHCTEGKLGFTCLPERSFPTLPSRDEIFRAVQDEIFTTGKPYGPCVLYQGKKTTNGRQPFVGIHDVEEVPERTTVENGVPF